MSSLSILGPVYLEGAFSRVLVLPPCGSQTLPCLMLLVFGRTFLILPQQQQTCAYYWCRTWDPRPLPILSPGFYPFSLILKPQSVFCLLLRATWLAISCFFDAFALEVEGSGQQVMFTAHFPAVAGHLPQACSSLFRAPGRGPWKSCE